MREIPYQVLECELLDATLMEGDMGSRAALAELLQQLRQMDAPTSAMLASQLEGIAMSPHVSDALIEALCDQTRKVIQLLSTQSHALH